MKIRRTGSAEEKESPLTIDRLWAIFEEVKYLVTVHTRLKRMSQWYKINMKRAH